MQRFGLRDDQWERIKDLLPGRECHVGGNAADNRLFVDAVLYRYRTGVPWRDLPARFGDWNIVYQRFNRWAKSGVFDRIFKLGFGAAAGRRRWGPAHPGHEIQREYPWSALRPMRG